MIRKLVFASAKLKRRAVQLGAAILLIGQCSNSPPPKDCQPTDLKLLTGVPNGYYDKVGRAIEAVAREKGLDICAQQVHQTFENVKKLDDEKTLTFALVQSDVAHDVWYRHPPFHTGPKTRVSLVMPLYIEAVHVLVRPHLNISTLSDLRNKKVWFGPKNSGTEFTAKRILAAAGLEPEKVMVTDDQVRTMHQPVIAQTSDLFCLAVDLLGAVNGLDAVFKITAVPDHQIQDVLKKDNKSQVGQKQMLKQDEKQSVEPECKNVKEVQLFALDFGLVERLVRDGSYMETLIDGKPYQKDNATLTVGVQALLLTNGGDWPPAQASAATSALNGDDVVEQLAGIVRDKRKDIERRLKEEERMIELEHGDKHTDSTLKLNLLKVTTHTQLVDQYHPRAEKFRYLWWQEFLFYFLPVVLTLFAVLYVNLDAVVRLARRQGEVAVLVAGTVAIWIGGAGTLRHFEWNVNEHFSSLPRALLFFPFYQLPFFSYAPLTQDGQSAVRIMSLVNFVLFGGFAIPVVKKLLQRLGRWLTTRLLKNPPLPENLEGHTVMINHSPRTDEVIKELHASEPGSRRKIVVVSSREYNHPASAEYNSLFALVGDPVTTACLKNARVPRADAVTILSAWPVDGERRRWLRGAKADGKTLLAIQAIYNLCKEENMSGTLQVRAEFWEDKYIEQSESLPMAVGSNGGKIQVWRVPRGSNLFAA